MEETEYDFSIPKEDTDEWQIEHTGAMRYDPAKKRQSYTVAVPHDDDFPRQATIFLEE